MAEEIKDTQGTEGTVDNNGQSDNTSTKAAEKTFTQAELDSIIEKRLARERSKMPSEEDMKAYNTWKASQQTEAEKYAELSKKFEAKDLELTALKNQQAVTKAECKPEFAEFVADKVAKMGDDFDKNLESFKKSNPQYFGSSTNFIKQSSSPKLTGGGSKSTTNELMNQLIRNARR